MKSHAGRIVAERRYAGFAPAAPCFAASLRQNRGAILPCDPPLELSAAMKFKNFALPCRTKKDIKAGL